MPKLKVSCRSLNRKTLSCTQARNQGFFIEVGVHCRAALATKNKQRSQKCTVFLCTNLSYNSFMNVMAYES